FTTIRLGLRTLQVTFLKNHADQSIAVEELVAEAIAVVLIGQILQKILISGKVHLPAEFEDHQEIVGQVQTVVLKVPVEIMDQLELVEKGQ
ncbi:hypothetical protein, partial [Leptospira santarosai]|uniref:hypothetical protein n=1 Tax=Leptospira santarosai TaxID=28183 RepID=UPI00159EBD9D